MPIPGYPNPGTLSSTNTLSKPQVNRPAMLGGAQRTYSAKEAASQTFDYGELVSLDSSFNVTNLFAKADPAANAVSSAGSSSTIATNSTLVAGIALVAAANAGAISTTKNIVVLIGDDSVEFFLRVYDATATNAVTSNLNVGMITSFFRYGGASISSTQRDCQTVFGYQANGTDAINKGQITYIPSEWASTDQYPAVWVKIRNAARQNL